MLSGIGLFLFLWYLKYKILKPFQKMNDLPRELSKGHLHIEIEENKHHFFGKFLWGISMLQDHLKEGENKSLKLEKEKKTLQLSISHDIKTPLGTIKLYAKALREGLYDTDEKRIQAAKQIEAHSVEIETFVKEIIRSSKEDILDLEVEVSEFYLRDLIKMLQDSYEPKCRLMMTDFTIGAYENKLLKGNKDRAFEVMENIIENAFKYGDGKYISIQFYEEDYCQLIKIKNSGEPIPSAQIPHIFSSFYRGSNAGEKEGNGLGLYICKELMHKMDGDIFTECTADSVSFVLVFKQ